MKLKKKILAILTCALMVIGGVGPSKSYANTKSVNIKDGGKYKIQSALKNNMLVDMTGNSNIHLWEDIGQVNAQWRFHYDKEKNSYKIVNIHNESMAMIMDKNASDRNVKAYNSEYWDDQFWIPEDAGNGYIYFKNKYDQSKYLTVSNRQTHNEANIHGYHHLPGDNAQKFKLEELAEYSGNQIFNDGHYRVGTYDFGGAQPWHMHINGSNVSFTAHYLIDSFKFEYYPNKGAYLIKYKNRHLTQEGNYLAMRDFYNTNSQYWILKYEKHNDIRLATYSIRNKATGQHLTRVNGGKELGMMNWYSDWDQAYVIRGGSAPLK